MCPRRSAPNADNRRLVPIRVLIVDDNLVVREGLEQVLAGQPNVEVVGSYTDLPSLLEAVEADPPDVVLTDIRMPPTSTDEGIRARDDPPGNPSVCRRGGAQPVRRADLRARLAGVGLRGSRIPPQGARARPRTAHDRARDRRGRRFGRGHQDRGHARSGEHTSRALPVGELTQREREVLAQIAQGKSNSAIADSLVLTKRAVEKHINSIFAKLNLSHAEQASKRVKATLAFLSEERVIGD
jgi:DNA-binding NarL/FixJ family response regulator